MVCFGEGRQTDGWTERHKPMMEREKGGGGKRRRLKINMGMRRLPCQSDSVIGSNHGFRNSELGKSLHTRSCREAGVAGGFPHWSLILRRFNHSAALHLH